MTIFTHHPRVSLAQSSFRWWRQNQLLMTSQWSDNCDAISWKVISNSLDINFIHGDIHGRSCKKHEYDIVISVRCVKSSIACVYILYVGMRCVFFLFSSCVCIWNVVPISIWIKITTWPGNPVLVRLLISGHVTKHYMMQRAGWVLSTKSRDHNNTAYQEWHINDLLFSIVLCVKIHVMICRVYDLHL